MHAEVQNYFSKANINHLADMVLLRKKILAALPFAEEGFQYGFPVYSLSGEPAAGFASREKGLMFYLMDPGIVAPYHEDLATRITGKTCIILKENSDTPKSIILDCIDRMLADVRSKHLS
ncbi:DUF1801 domain-containing protein [Metabacillus indicus]|uniref:YdhG-like domain-containing protein n=1 Tax=Metabacillus indicus TaxID=246786 RepID=A0A084GNS2_METID|nr:DUF1801 domain-containing protein [Metabacillus indicus]KEZ48984.1 hypothetical protein GS18_0216355 [Metabacillus indicus]KEZ49311.1 hypothetical protein AZ46_0214740 [Metabacillus indicus LMG 22858]MDX8289781.1 DUF1801 domain-containing protein [Metabacillus indicus]